MHPSGMRMLNVYVNNTFIQQGVCERQSTTSQLQSRRRLAHGARPLANGRVAHAYYLLRKRALLAPTWSSYIAPCFHLITVLICTLYFLDTHIIHSITKNYWKQNWLLLENRSGKQSLSHLRTVHTLTWYLVANSLGSVVAKPSSTLRSDINLLFAPRWFLLVLGPGFVSTSPL